MAPVDETNFTAWNETMSIEHNPDMQHNHPNPLIRFMEAKRTSSVLKYLAVEVSDMVLDVGCGAGNMLARVKQGKLHGMDLSDFALGLAKEKLNAKALLQKGNAEILHFSDMTFDKIFCSEVLEHTLNPERVVHEIFRIIKPDGLYVISIPNETFSIHIKRLLRASGIYRFFFVENKKEKCEISDICEWHLHIFDLATLRKLVRGKFKITAIKGIPFNCIPIKYVVRMKKIDA